MSDQNQSSPAGAILFTIGIVIFAFVILTRALEVNTGPITRFFEDYIFIPIVLIFVGRSMMRRGRRSVEESQTQMEMPSRTATQRTPRQEPRPVARNIDLQTWREETPVVVPAPPARTSKPSQPKPQTAAGSDRIEPLYVPPPKGEFKPRSSEEMLAEAKERLISKPRPGKGQ